MAALLQLTNINKSFGPTRVLDNYNLTVDKGEMIALVGPSGAGKTTLLNIIGGLDFDYEGTYTYKGEPVGNSARQSRKLRETELAYLFQNFALLEDVTVEKNLRIVTNDRQAMERALSRVGLDGYLKKKIYTLSGGEQQRVALARVLVKDASLILADEPTGSLDDTNAERVMGLLRELKDEGKTIVVVTHNTGILPHFDRVVTISR